MNASMARLTWMGTQEFLPCFITKNTYTMGLKMLSTSLFVKRETIFLIMSFKTNMTLSKVEIVFLCD